MYFILSNIYSSVIRLLIIVEIAYILERTIHRFLLITTSTGSIL